MEMEFKACPFCGQDAATLYRNYSGRLRKYFVWVECDTCGARSKATAEDSDPADENWESAECRRVVGAWNMRAGCADAQ